MTTVHKRLNDIRNEDWSQWYQKSMEIVDQDEDDHNLAISQERVRIDGFSSHRLPPFHKVPLKTRVQLEYAKTLIRERNYEIASEILTSCYEDLTNDFTDPPDSIKNFKKKVAALMVDAYAGRGNFTEARAYSTAAFDMWGDKVSKYL